MKTFKTLPAISVLSPWKEHFKSVTCIKFTSCCSPEEHCSLLKFFILHLTELNMKIIIRKRSFLNCLNGLHAVLFSGRKKTGPAGYLFCLEPVPFILYKVLN